MGQGSLEYVDGDYCNRVNTVFQASCVLQEEVFHWENSLERGGKKEEHVLSVVWLDSSEHIVLRILVSVQNVVYAGIKLTMGQSSEAWI